MQRALFAFAPLALCLACGSGAPLADLPARRGINVIVVSFDALRPDVLGAYGHPRRTSPNIDAFAEGAVVFENAYTISPLTPFSFAAAFTGRYPTRDFRNWTITDRLTLAGLFASAGYRTGGFLNNAHLSRERGFARGFQVYELYEDPEPAADAQLLSSALAWIDSVKAEPFFAWLHFIDPHTPWDRRDESSHLYDSGYTGSASTSASAFAQHDPEVLAHWRNLYEGEVFAIDGLFRTLLDHLESRDLLEQSILVLTSDHGEELMEHGRLQHGQLTEENVRIPIVLHHPDVRRGRRVTARASLLDLMPTLAGLAALGSLEIAELDGRDLRRASGDVERLVGVTQVSAQGWQQASLRVGDHKLILECGRRVAEGTHPQLQLYDLARDPGETRSLVPSEPEQADRLRRELLAELGIEDCQALRRWASWRHEGLTTRQRRQLEALGYIRHR